MNKYFKENTKDPEVFQARAHDSWIMMNTRESDIHLYNHIYLKSTHEHKGYY